jgi:Domain of unknown function (DUF4219)
MCPLDDEGTKYTSWSHTMMLVLQRRQLWDVVSGAERAPNAIVLPSDYRAWLDKDQEALLQIVTTLKEGPHHSIPDAKTSKECWDILAKRYRAKGNQWKGISWPHSQTPSPSKGNLINSN